jgi:hypothetical protein
MINTHPVPENNARIGLHYYPDTLHYRESDLLTWLPMLKTLGAQWLTMTTPTSRAIPEIFIKGMHESGIEPVLHLRPGLSSHPKQSEIEVMLDCYADWGVRYIALFDRPNMQASWSKEDWVQQRLVERYLDIFIRYAEIACQYGMYPILSPLEPGGNFWDTAFLRNALQGIKERGHKRLLSRLVIGAYAWPSNRPLNWGSGGPERWPGSRPYFTPAGEEDQLGFRIFDWYNALSEAALNTRRPIMLMGTGCRMGDQKDPQQPAIDEQLHAAQNLTIAKLLAGEAISGANALDPIPDNVLAGNFWLLSSDLDGQDANQAWFKANGETLEAVSLIQGWWENRDPVQPKAPTCKQKSRVSGSSKTIQHYLLLPLYEWGISEWHLEISQPFIKKHKPTVGFSVDEACLAKVVTVVGGEQSFQPSVLEKLKRAGCHVRQVRGDGTSIATQLEEL